MEGLRVHFTEHVSWEKPAYIGQLVYKYGYSYTTTALYRQESLPEAGDIDLLVMMGGPMSVHDEQAFPWLRNEKKLAEAMIEAGKPVLGVCLGAQILAQVLGAEVGPAEQAEIGWFPIHVDKNALPPYLESWPETFTALHWHQEAFTTPSNAVSLGASEACGHQGFIYDGKWAGLQYHLEFTPEHLSNMLRHATDDLQQSGAYIQTEEDIRNGQYHLYDNHQILKPLLEHLIERGQRSAT